MRPNPLGNRKTQGLCSPGPADFCRSAAHLTSMIMGLVLIARNMYFWLLPCDPGPDCFLSVLFLAHFNKGIYHTLFEQSCRQGSARFDYGQQLQKFKNHSKINPKIYTKFRQKNHLKSSTKNLTIRFQKISHQKIIHLKIFSYSASCFTS